jgi:hypothetical protein
MKKPTMNPKHTMLCPDCLDEPMNYSRVDSDIDDGDLIDEVLTCPLCGFSARRELGSGDYFEGVDGSFFEVEADDSDGK